LSFLPAITQVWPVDTGRGVLCALLLALCVALVGCKVDLHANLGEKDANLILAALIENGIAATKSEGEGGFSVRVAESDIAAAVAVLTAKGLPREKYASLGATFQKSGIISSPFEDRVRYIYALGEEVAATISEIDGVISARVHVVLPDQSQFGSTPKPSSAAVFIKHDPLVDLAYLVPQIRRLVSSSIEGLDYSAVTVLLAEGGSPEREAQRVEQSTVSVLPGLAIRETDVLYFWRIAYLAGVVIAVLILIILGFLSYVVFYRDGRWFGADEGGDAVESR